MPATDLLKTKRLYSLLGDNSWLRVRVRVFCNLEVLGCGGPRRQKCAINKPLCVCVFLRAALVLTQGPLERIVDHKIIKLT